MIKNSMELYDKLSLLESKIDKLIADAKDAVNGKAKLQQEYDELLGRFIVLEDELGRIKEDKELARQKLESIIAKFDMN